MECFYLYMNALIARVRASIHQSFNGFTHFRFDLCKRCLFVSYCAIFFFFFLFLHYPNLPFFESSTFSIHIFQQLKCKASIPYSHGDADAVDIMHA